MSKVMALKTFRPAVETAANRTAQVLEVAYTTAALRTADPNLDLKQEIDRRYSQYPPEIRREGERVGAERCIPEFLTQTISLFLPKGVSPQHFAAIFGESNILDEINVQVKDWNSSVRQITYTRPPRALEDLSLEINQVPNRQQNGVRPDSRLMCGFKGDVVPTRPLQKTVFIYFGLRDTSRQYEIRDMKAWGHVHAPPGDLMLPLAAQLAKYGSNHEKGNLLRYDGVRFIARTEQAKTNKGIPIWGLQADDDIGVDLPYAGTGDPFHPHSYVVPAGRSDH